jgi:Mg/Co/Ni transporter MgtE
VLENTEPVEVPPFATEAQVDQDLETADLLYLPMPFGTEHESFARYSISTKMVTYVGSGVPILYHGPATSAAFDLLDRHRAAIVVNSLDPQQIAHALETAANGRAAEIAQNALELARHQFLLTDQRNRFWDTIRRLV